MILGLGLAEHIGTACTQAQLVELLVNLQVWHSQSSSLSLTHLCLLPVVLNAPNVSRPCVDVRNGKRR